MKMGLVTGSRRHGHGNGTEGRKHDEGNVKPVHVESRTNSSFNSEGNNNNNKRMNCCVRAGTEVSGRYGACCLYSQTSLL